MGVADLNYRQSRLGVALMGLASRLRTLGLDHVYAWDTGDLRAVGQHCRHLGEGEFNQSVGALSQRIGCLKNI